MLKYAKYIISLFIIATILFTVVVYSIAIRHIPSDKELTNIKNAIASEVYTSDSVLIGKFYFENRTNVAYEDISIHILNALISTEDIRFFEHEGIDQKSLLRVLFKTILMGDRSAGGGSTITQQLAKNLFPRKERYPFARMLFYKIKEAVVAHKLEQNYSKEEIITLYLNTIPFGENIYGIETAAKRFFSTNTQEIKVQEAATLIGLLKANHTYNPRLFPGNSIKRRNVVLSQMAKYNYISEDKLDSLLELPIDLKYQKPSSLKGSGLYFQQYLKGQLLEWLESENKSKGTEYNLFTDGLKIYTSINYQMQVYAEEAVAEHMAALQNEFRRHWNKQDIWNENSATLNKLVKQSTRYKALKSKGASESEIETVFNKPLKMEIYSASGVKEVMMSPLDSIKYYNAFLQTGFLVVDPFSGNVLAWVGGVDYNYFQYDHVLSKRQVGSIFKPIVYATALEEGIDPCEYISNEKVVYTEYEDWSPSNADDNYEGYYSMQGGLTHSVNTIAVKLIMEVGVDRVIRFAEKSGIKSEIPKEPSIALGSVEASLYEMLNVYTCFANGGNKVTLSNVLSIKTENGESLYQKEPEVNSSVMKNTTSKIITTMLQSVVDSGTARSLRGVYGFNFDIAGKTGTTQSHADGWFVGYTSNLVAGAWVGGEYPFIHFRNITQGQGAHTALPIWAKFMNKLQKDKELNSYVKEEFEELDAELQGMLDCDAFIEHKNVFKSIWDEVWGRKRNLKDTIRRKNIFEKVKKIFKKNNDK